MECKLGKFTKARRSREVLILEQAFNCRYESRLKGPLREAKPKLRQVEYGSQNLVLAVPGWR